jgi:predicted ester cyclase
MTSPDSLIRFYYDCFNQRRGAEAARLFTDSAVLDFMQPTVWTTGFDEFEERWHRAFPDGVLTVERVEQRNERMCEVDLIGIGTHLGTLDFGIYQFKPTGARTHIRLRQLFEFHEGKIAFSSLSFDHQDFIRQLTRLDRSALIFHLDRIVHLRETLATLLDNPQREREILEQLGRELDGARKQLRPYFYRE